MRTYRPGILRGLTSLIALLALAACGGGGGDSPPPLTPVVYTGSIVPAVVTATNASQLTADVIGSEDASSTIVGAATVTGAAGQDRTGGAVDLALRLNRSLRDTVLRLNDAKRVAPAAQVNQTEPCDNGVGSIPPSGPERRNPHRNVEVTLTMPHRRRHLERTGDTHRARVQLRLSQGIPSDSTLSFVRLTIVGLASVSMPPIRAPGSGLRHELGDGHDEP
jgi:hypothetical protein